MIINGINKNLTKFKKNIICVGFLKKYVHSVNVFDPNPTSNGTKIGDVVITTKNGLNLILDPLLNKGTGFNMFERERLGIRGLVPPRQPPKDCLDWQVKKIMTRYRELTTSLQKFTYMNSLHDRNEVLFFKCLEDNLEELAPIIYTPTVGEACLNFAFQFRRPRGMYFSSEDKGEMASMTFNWHTDDVELIVVTDGSRILGLGDLGANGMGIPIGKLALYTIGAGIHPSKTLPILIDVGTNNEKLINDPHYLGLPRKRLKGKEYDDIIDEFITAVSSRFPNALIQFEDFSTENAAKILEKYRNKILCFNDDMQGTATVTLAGILSSLRSLGHKEPEKALHNQRIVIAGAGTAGIGVARGILFNMIQSGLSEVEAKKQFWIYDEHGSLGKGRKMPYLNQSFWVRDDIEDKLCLENLISEVKPTILLGLTGVGGIFTQNVIQEMSRYCRRPILFPLSNPTSQAECTAIDAYQWTLGKCIFASGSPFASVTVNGKEYFPAQSNNMYSYPGIGLGTLVCKAKSITDNMLNAAALTLADSVSQMDFDVGRIFPSVADIPKISKRIAFSVAKQAIKDNNSLLKFTDDELIEKIDERFWLPKYGSLNRVDPNKI